MNRLERSSRNRGKLRSWLPSEGRSPEGKLTDFKSLCKLNVAKTKKDVSISKAVEEIDFTKPETDTITETERQKVLSIIENSGDQGVRTVDVALRTQLSDEQTENIIRELVKEGEIFHPKPGFVQYIG